MIFIKSYILKLREKIRYYNYLYYSFSSQKISDCRYDYLMKKLRYLENKYKHFLFMKDSPTFQVGSLCASDLKTYKHITPMLSLNHVFSIRDYLNFYKKTKKVLKKQIICFCCELKLDGLALNLVYEKGKLVIAMTRGNGILGENVTDNVKKIFSIPKKLVGKDVPEKIEVRGEVFMLKNDFIRLNNIAVRSQMKKFSNTRNASSGLLRQKNLKNIFMNNLMFCCYGYGYCSGNDDILNHYDKLQKLHSWGLPISGYNCVFNSNYDILNFYNKIESIRSFLNFNIDGIVIKVNSIPLQNKLGYTRRAPVWAIALKFFDQEKTSKILKIEYKIGRTGVITPIAVVDPICISGVIIRRISLYNFHEIKKLGIRLGDIVKIKRSGDVIPKIISVVRNCSNDVQDIVFPHLCPSCRSKLKIYDKRIKIRCINNLKCKEQLKKTLYYFCSKSGLNILGLGFKTVSKLVNKNYVKNFSDFFNLHENALITLDEVGKKNASNIIDAIHNSKNITFSKFLCALGIDEIGTVKSDILSKHFLSLSNLMNATFSEICSLKGIGFIASRNIFNFINDESNKNVILNLSKSLNISSSYDNVSYVRKSSNPFFKKKIVFSGTLNKFSRSQAVDIIKELGGNVMSNVSIKTDYIVIGKNPGSKFFKSNILNIKVILEQNFLEIIKNYL
ncbi:MAG: NAD-dependent DNA ligase LigA [Buchnera aphidicola (Nurudea shiraii)]